MTLLIVHSGQRGALDHCPAPLAWSPAQLSLFRAPVPASRASARLRQASSPPTGRGSYGSFSRCGGKQDTQCPSSCHMISCNGAGEQLIPLHPVSSRAPQSGNHANHPLRNNKTEAGSNQTCHRPPFVDPANPPTQSGVRISKAALNPYSNGSKNVGDHGDNWFRT